MGEPKLSFCDVPYLSKEDFLFQLQTTFEMPVVNLRSPKEERAYAKFLLKSGYLTFLMKIKLRKN